MALEVFAQSVGLLGSMHASFSGSQAVLVPVLSVSDHFLWYGAFTGALWALVLLLVVVRRVRTRREVRPAAPRPAE
jgi:membrane protein implicated in regulation of membrane protease activity